MIWYLGLLGYFVIGISIIINYPHRKELSLFSKISFSTCWLPMLLWTLIRDAVAKKI